MQVSVLLQRKGSEVVTVVPEAQVSSVAALLAERRIGAVVVSRDGATIDGVLSERDIVTAIAERGAAALQEPASSIMTTSVFTCEPDTTVEQLMETMTDQRVRHVPVLVSGSLAGIVSIGDVVKDRISSLQSERDSLQSYITHPY
jgi:CBS domain-containing protein